MLESGSVRRKLGYSQRIVFQNQIMNANHAVRSTAVGLRLDMLCVLPCCTATVVPQWTNVYGVLVYIQIRACSKKHLANLSRRNGLTTPDAIPIKTEYSAYSGTDTCWNT